MCTNVYISRLLNQGADPSAATVKSAAAGAPPPPPPPAIQPPSEAPVAKSAAKDDSEADRAALFAAINKGSAVTSGMVYTLYHGHVFNCALLSRPS